MILSPSILDMPDLGYLYLCMIISVDTLIDTPYVQLLSTGKVWTSDIHKQGTSPGNVIDLYTFSVLIIDSFNVQTIIIYYDNDYYIYPRYMTAT